MLIMLIIRQYILTILYNQLSMTQLLLTRSRFYIEECSLYTFPGFVVLRNLLSQTTDL